MLTLKQNLVGLEDHVDAWVDVPVISPLGRRTRPPFSTARISQVLSGNTPAHHGGPAMLEKQGGLVERVQSPGFKFSLLL